MNILFKEDMCVEEILKKIADAIGDTSKLPLNKIRAYCRLHIINCKDKENNKSSEGRKKAIAIYKKAILDAEIDNKEFLNKILNSCTPCPEFYL